ncbi:uncharacterized protein LOC142651756 isoform X2 [Rhinoderma darwinii]|uniref:uncharacterized protein LOC142651756 isoform X2 n=1 Tax=Rhinoderma darwinii TaxID=43563 RepID=UPI003F667EFF
MSVHREVASESKKKSFFCKVCKVAYLNSDGLHSHFKDEEHKKMESAYYGQRYEKYFYSSLQDYIFCPMRKEPLIGLQYIIQLYPEVDSKDAFKCSLCKVIGPLYFIIMHIESVKHRRKYLSIAYQHLFPLYTKGQSFYKRNMAVRDHAIKVEQQEKTLSIKDSKSCTSRIGVKSDFLKYNIKRQEMLEEYKQKLSAYEVQKNNILQYMETLVITSPEEAALVEDLTEELEAAVNVFNLNTKSKNEKSSIRECEQSPENIEARYSKHSDFNRNEKRSIWYEKEHTRSCSLCKNEVQSPSDKDSATVECRKRKRSGSASKDMLLRVTFSTGSESEAKNAPKKDPQEQQESPSACPVKEKLVWSSDKFWETTKAMCHNLNVNSDLFQKIKGKRFTKHSTDVAKWESLFANNRPELSHSTFSWGPKSPSLNDAEAFPSNGKKENTRRASLDALSTFTLFSQEEHEPSPANWHPSSDTFLLLRSPGFKPYTDTGFQDKGLQHEPKQVEDNAQELPCSSNTICNEVANTDDAVMHAEPEKHDECKLISHSSGKTSDAAKIHQNTDAETCCDQLSDVNAHVALAPKPSHALDASSEYPDLKPCGSRYLDTKADGQDADSNHLGNTLQLGKLHASGRQLSPEVLQLFKGKDSNSIVHILKTLSPFYPALQELDLEEFAKVLSKTGAITE